MLLKSLKRTVGDTAKKSAKQIVVEPLEILKTAKSQVSEPLSQNSQSRFQESSKPQEERKEIGGGEKKKSEMSSQRFVEALENEIKEIREEREKKYQERVKDGESKEEQAEHLVVPSGKIKGPKRPGKGKSNLSDISAEISKNPSG